MNPYGGLKNKNIGMGFSDVFWFGEAENAK
jgi:hypothetical protein